MKRLAFCFVLMSLAVFGQTVATYPTTVLGLGVGYNGSVAPGAYYGHQVPVPSNLSISEYVTAYALTGVEFLRPHFNPLTVETAVFGGVCALSNKAFGPVIVGDCVLEGGSFTNTAMGNLVGDKPFVVYHLNKSGTLDLVASGDFLHAATDNQLHIGAQIALQYNLGRKPTTLALAHAKKAKVKK